MIEGFVSGLVGATLLLATIIFSFAVGSSGTQADIEKGRVIYISEKAYRCQEFKDGGK